MFDSFFLAGFECATGYNVHRRWFDQTAATQHERFAGRDYARLREVGIRAAREGVRWPLVDRGRGRYDFSSIIPFVEAARRHGVRVIWDFFHFGYPEGVDLFGADFPARFADYCRAAARFISERSPAPHYFTPVNEPSYFSWAAGEMGLFAPHAVGRGWELKVNLAGAAIKGINAIWEACPGARIVNVDPLCRVHAPEGRPELRQEAERFNRDAVFQGWDILSGRLLPELGGSPRHLDIVGVNYYWTNQWELQGTGQPLAAEDGRCCPLRALLREVWERYGAEMLITETSHVGEMRPRWLRQMTGEVEAALGEGVPVRGVCLYPILGMPEWHDRQAWTRMGLWDLEPHDGDLRRVLYRPMLEALREAQQRLEGERAFAAVA